VLEFNVRFGDPETQVILPLLEDDLVSLLLLSASGEEMPSAVKFKEEYAMVVVLASKGYPGAYPKDELITEPDTAKPGRILIHAGTKSDGENIVSSGGRVLGAVGVGPTLKNAKEKAYALVDAVHFDSKYFRTDIGYREFSRSQED
jgi:phosphoribosylamine-glycine ligase